MLVIGALVVAATGCGGDPAPPPGPRYLDVAMSEFRFNVSGALRSGRTVITVRNVGQLQHEFILEELPADFPPFDQQIHSTQRRSLPTLALARRDPGGSRTFAVDLKPGRYAIVCFIHDPDGLTHALKGMDAELRVR